MKTELELLVEAQSDERLYVKIIFFFRATLSNFKILTSKFEVFENCEFSRYKKSYPTHLFSNLFADTTDDLEVAGNEFGSVNCNSR